MAAPAVDRNRRRSRGGLLGDWIPNERDRGTTGALRTSGGLCMPAPRRPRALLADGREIRCGFDLVFVETPVSARANPPAT